MIKKLYTIKNEHLNYYFDNDLRHTHNLLNAKMFKTHDEALSNLMFILKYEEEFRNVLYLTIIEFYIYEEDKK